MVNQPDKGYAWAVAISSIFIMFIGQSTLASYGSIVSSVRMSLSTRMWIIDIMYALYCASALLVGPLIQMTSHRKVALVGCLGVTCGFLLTGTTLDSPPWLFLTLSSFVGIGLGLAVHSTFLLVAAHFAYYRGLASGFGLLSQGAGNLLYPLIYDWIDSPKDRCNLRALAAAMCFMSISFYLPPPLPSSSSSASAHPLSKSKSSNSISNGGPGSKFRGKQGQQQQQKEESGLYRNRSGSREKIPLVGTDEDDCSHSNFHHALRQRRPSQFMLSIEKTLLPFIPEEEAESSSQNLSQTESQSQANSKSSSIVTLSSGNNPVNNNNSSSGGAPMDLTINLQNNIEENEEEGEETSSANKNKEEEEEETPNKETNQEEREKGDEKPQPDLVLSSSASPKYGDKKCGESVINIPEEKSECDSSNPNSKSTTTSTIQHLSSTCYHPYRKLSLTDSPSSSPASSPPASPTNPNFTPVKTGSRSESATAKRDYDEYRRKIMELNEKENERQEREREAGGGGGASGKVRSNSIISLVTIKSSLGGGGGESRTPFLRILKIVQKNLRHFKEIDFQLLKNIKFLNMTLGPLFLLILSNLPIILYAHVGTIISQSKSETFLRNGGRIVNNNNNNNNSSANNIPALDQESSSSSYGPNNVPEAQFVLIIIFSLDLFSRFIFSYISDFAFFNRRFGFLFGALGVATIALGIGFLQDIKLIYVLCVTYGIFLGLMIVTESLMFADVFGIERLQSAYGFIGFLKMILILILSSSTALQSPSSSFVYKRNPPFHIDVNDTVCNQCDPLDLFSSGKNSTTSSLESSTSASHHQHLLCFLAIPGILCIVTWSIEFLWTYKLADKFKKKTAANFNINSNKNTNSSPVV